MNGIAILIAGAAAFAAAYAVIDLGRARALYQDSLRHLRSMQDREHEERRVPGYIHAGRGHEGAGQAQLIPAEADISSSPASPRRIGYEFADERGQWHMAALDPTDDGSIRRFLAAVREEGREQSATSR